MLTKAVNDLTKEDLIEYLSSGMTCQIIGLRHNSNHNKINRLLRKFNINRREIQSDLPKYYVYIHKYNGHVFYVGSAQGNPRRMWSLLARSEEWTKYVKNINYQFEAEIIEICENKNLSASREKFWGQHYIDIGMADLYFEDLRGDKNPIKNKENQAKAVKNKLDNQKKRDIEFAKSFIENRKPQKIENTGRNRKMVAQFFNGELVETYESIAHASRVVGCHASTISRACSNNKPYRGFEWKWITIQGNGGIIVDEK